eukprot:5055194-Alexandrium_andersonii.AAC.1
MSASLVGSEMCIRDSPTPSPTTGIRAFDTFGGHSGAGRPRRGRRTSRAGKCGTEPPPCAAEGPAAPWPRPAPGQGGPPARLCRW